jgi:murein DD-endopeptidase MepM/ murein hydrolase activator NlpD
MGASADDGFLAYMLDQPLTVSPMTAYAIGGPRAKNPTMIGPVPKDWPYGSGNFMWPVFGWMSQGYREDHRAIDIAASPGTFVTAADRGVVMRSGWNDQGYGMFVVIDHNIDYITLYAHLTEVLVKEGDIVSQGQIIGTIGSTGNSTGPHLHFEIRDFGRRANPLDFLVH